MMMTMVFAPSILYKRGATDAIDAAAAATAVFVKWLFDDIKWENVVRTV